MLRIRRLVLATAGLMALALNPIGASGALAGPPSAAKKAPQIDAPDRALVRVHGWHCRRLYAPQWGWHRHRGACRSNRRNRSRRHYQPNSRNDDLYEPYRPGVPPHRKALTDAYRKKGREEH